MEVIQLITAIARISFHALLIPVYLLTAIWRAIFDGEGKNLEGQIALVTGAGNGLGREMTLKLVSQGVQVLGVDLRDEDLFETVKMAEEITKVKGNVHPYICDISDRTAIAKLRDAVLKDHGHIDILINNAAILYKEEFDSGEDAHIERVMNTNILGNLWMTRAFLPSMKNREKGHIVFISSISSVLPHKDLCMYSATKSALTALGQCLRQSLDGQKRLKNIKVTIVHPAVMNTSIIIEPMIKTVVKPISCNFAAGTIINAIRNEYTDISLPGGELGYRLLHIFKLLPTKLQSILYDAGQVRFGQINNKPLLDTVINGKITYTQLQKQYEMSDHITFAS